MREFAKLEGCTSTVFGEYWGISNIPACTGKYTNKEAFLAKIYQYNRNQYSLNAIELIGWLNKWSLYQSFGRQSKPIWEFSHILARDMVNFWQKAPEQQAEVTVWLVDSLRTLLANTRKEKRTFNAEREFLNDFIAFFSAFYEAYLYPFEQYNNTELCK